jgi:hypothetical protein
MRGWLAEAVAGKERVLGQMQENPKTMRDRLIEGVADLYEPQLSHAEDAVRLHLQDRKNTVLVSPTC